jgi:hypothetical protein
MPTTKKPSKAKAKTTKGIDMKEGARRVIARAKGPLHYQEITKRMLDEGKVVTKGKTPAQSVSAKLATCAARQDTFVRTGPGVYDLIERHKEGEGTASAAE